MDNRHILIVDDEAQIAVSLRRALEHHLDARYQVVAHSRPAEALAELSGKPFDLVVTDLRMPEMNGLELIRHARQISPGTRMILITAFGSPEVMHQADQLGVTYFPKPFKLRDFIRAVQGILNGADGQASNVRAEAKPGYADRASRHL